MKIVRINGTVYALQIVTEDNTTKVVYYENNILVAEWVTDINGKSVNKYDALNEFLHTTLAKALVKRQEWLTLAEYMEYFFSTKDSGKNGKIFEIIVKLYLNGYKGNSTIVSSKGKVDVTYKGKTIEVKSNCGEIDDIHKSKYIIYTMYAERDIATPFDAFVLNTEDFIQVLNTCNLIKRTKKVNGYIKHNIQSYKNSNKRSRLFDYQLTDNALGRLDEWKATL